MQGEDLLRTLVGARQSPDTHHYTQTYVSRGESSLSTFVGIDDPHRRGARDARDGEHYVSSLSAGLTPAVSSACRYIAK